MFSINSHLHKSHITHFPQSVQTEKCHIKLLSLTVKTAHLSLQILIRDIYIVSRRFPYQIYICYNIRKSSSLPEIEERGKVVGEVKLLHYLRSVIKINSPNNKFRC